MNWTIYTSARKTATSCHAAWHPRDRADGKQICRKMADYSDQYRTLKSMRPLADEILRPINEGLGL